MSSPSHTSMDVHVGSSPPRSDGATMMHASLASNKQVSLEVGELDARSLVSAGGAELTLGNVLQIVLAFIVLLGKLSFLYSFVFDHMLSLMECLLS